MLLGEETLVRGMQIWSGAIPSPHAWKNAIALVQNTGGLTVAEPTFPSFGPVNAKSLTQKFDPALSVGKRDLRRQIESPESIGLLATLQKFAVQDAIEDPFNKYCKSVKRLSRQETPNSVGGKRILHYNMDDDDEEEEEGNDSNEDEDEDEDGDDDEDEDEDGDDDEDDGDDDDDEDEDEDDENDDHDDDDHHDDDDDRCDVHDADNNEDEMMMMMMMMRMRMMMMMLMMMMMMMMMRGR